MGKLGTGRTVAEERAVVEERGPVVEEHRHRRV